MKIVVDLDNADQCFEVGLAAFNRFREDINNVSLAVRLASRALELRPDWGQARVLLGAATLYGSEGKQSEVAKAEEILRRCIEAEPANADAHFFLGQSMDFHGRQADSAPYYRRAAELRPDWWLAYKHWGQGLVEAGDYEAAKTPLTTALQHFPEDEGLVRLLDDVEYILKRRHDPASMSRWPLQLREFDDIEKAVRRYILGDLENIAKFLKPTSNVRTMGSCFATNVAHALKALGIDAQNMAIGEDINSTYANRYFLDWITGNPDTRASRDVLDVIERVSPLGRDEARDFFRNADIVIYTPGVAPCFFDKSGAFVFPKKSDSDIRFRESTSTYHRLAHELDFRTTTVQENVDNLLYIIESLKSINSRMNIIFSISPVPLKLTFEYRSAIMADCVSKSTLRVAVDQVIRERVDGVFYWPSFEIVRWLSAYVPGMYGAEDKDTRHVSESIIKTIMKLFIETFGDLPA